MNTETKVRRLMEFIPIGKSKLKIIMSADDMLKFGIDLEAIEHNDRSAVSALTDIIKGGELGFDIKSSKLYIQCYPSREGGCEMYVTRLGDSASPKNSHKEDPLSGRRRVAYSFENLRDLISVCKRLFSIGYSEVSEAFSCGSKFLLLLSEPEENAYIPLSEFSFIREYGKSESIKSSELLISERCRQICSPNAVEILSSF